jgi:hypothetical protein
VWNGICPVGIEEQHPRFTIMVRLLDDLIE